MGNRIPCLLKKECVLYPADREKYPEGITYPCYTLGMRTVNTVTFGIPEKLEYTRNGMILEDIPGTIDTSYGIMMSPTKENLSIWRETNEQNVASWEAMFKRMNKDMSSAFAKKCLPAVTTIDEIIIEDEDSFFGNMYNCHVWYEVDGEIHDYGPNVQAIQGKIMFGTEYKSFPEGLQEGMKNHLIDLWEGYDLNTGPEAMTQQHCCINRAMALHKLDPTKYNFTTLCVGTLGLKLKGSTYLLYGRQGVRQQVVRNRQTNTLPKNTCKIELRF
tara:strand:- start:15 stop:833 length:819 start_codon:yes stop_codon:yes gene_type:complete